MARVRSAFGSSEARKIEVGSWKFLVSFDVEKYFNALMDLDPKIFRTIIFVRHGQYHREPERLTNIGHRQAQLAARALKAVKPAKLYSSTMPRAKETAQIIGTQVKLKAQSKVFFQEALLPGTVDYHKMLSQKYSKAKWLKVRKEMKSAKRSADEAFDFIFKAPKRGQTCEVVVAHGNVIRHWVCKALKISEEKWLSMDIVHSSMTKIRLDNKGNFVLLGFSDCGHLPLKMRTYV